MGARVRMREEMEVAWPHQMKGLVLDRLKGSAQASKKGSAGMIIVDKMVIFYVHRMKLIGSIVYMPLLSVVSLSFSLQETVRGRLAGWHKGTLNWIVLKFVLKHSTILVDLIGRKKLGIKMQIAQVQIMVFTTQNEQLGRRK